MKKKFFLYASIIFFTIIATKIWWVWVKNPLSNAIHTQQESLLEYTAKKNTLITQNNTAKDYELNLNDVINPAEISSILTAASPQSLILTAIKKTSSAQSKNFFQVGYKIDGEATYAQFLSFITALKSNPGIFFESLQYITYQHPVGRFSIHIYVYSESP